MLCTCSDLPDRGVRELQLRERLFQAGDALSQRPRLAGPSGGAVRSDRWLDPVVATVHFGYPASMPGCLERISRGQDGRTPWLGVDTWSLTSVIVWHVDRLLRSCTSCGVRCGDCSVSFHTIECWPYESI